MVWKRFQVGQPLQMDRREIFCCRKTSPYLLLFASGLKRVCLEGGDKWIRQRNTKWVSTWAQFCSSWLVEVIMKQLMGALGPWLLSWSGHICLPFLFVGKRGPVLELYHAVFHVNIWKKVICHSYLIFGKYQTIWMCIPNGSIDAICIFKSWVYVYWLYVHSLQVFWDPLPYLSILRQPRTHFWMLLIAQSVLCKVRVLVPLAPHCGHLHLLVLQVPQVSII